ncbi:hypothetical protein [Endozoicomonas sp. SCSIO W0465]|uniref:hypothetical protein n=1 Tax=Endozoicomonas sp. SCSIO W0465 TaxID=2918516 RepID=UPI00207608D9|nr:hypothetical protein [Endozoicomonas sp. SCSIO W0465]USE36295.1 hypothetical protein MJO57_30430 [Endozoicomonas sp. SCSIO W0465]
MTDAVSEESPSLYSPPAYTTGGYCVSGQVRPYKHRSGTSYLGVYIAVWKGQYDEQISWPMRKMIRLSVINQYNPSENVGFTFPTDDKPGFQRPTTLINSRSGFPKFFMLKPLNDSEFVKNDTLHIEIKLEDPAPGSFGVAEKH